MALLTYTSKDIDDCLYTRDKGVDKMMYSKTEQVRFVPFGHVNPGFTD